MPPFTILCEDGPLLAVNKPAGLPTQGVPAGVPSLEAAVREYLKKKYSKPGNVYLGIPHRLDRPVSGVVIFARNSKAAARLAEQFRLRQVRKWYLAVVEGRPDPAEGTLSDWLLKEPDVAKMNVVPEGTPGAKLATLSYRVVEAPEMKSLLPRGGEGGRRPDEGVMGGQGHDCESASVERSPPLPNPLPHGGEGTGDRKGEETSDRGRNARGQNQSLVLIELHTGRMHQIRVQFASRGWPIVGDVRYGFSKPGGGDDETVPEAIALHAARLDLQHPVRYDPISLIAPLPESWRQYGFDVSHAAEIAALSPRPRVGGEG